MWPIRHSARSLAFALAALLLTAIPASAAVQFDGRWQTPGLNDWAFVDSEHVGNTNVLSYVTSPRRRASGYSPSLLVGGANKLGERIEYQRTVFANATGRDAWLAWSIYLPSDSGVFNAMYVTQVKSRFNASLCGNPGSLPASISFRMANPANFTAPATNWIVEVGGGVGSCGKRVYVLPAATFPLTRDRWVDWECHVHWAPTLAGLPLTQCWMRYAGVWVQAFRDTGPNLERSPTFDGDVIARHGLYKAESETQYAHLFLGGLVIADAQVEAEAAF
jgi:hypothetical protein